MKICPVDGCDYTSSEHGILVHIGKKHGANTEVCDNCGKEFKKHPSKSKPNELDFCTNICKNEYRTGDNNPNGSNSVTITCENCGCKKKKPRSVAERGQSNHFCNENCMVACWRENHIQSGKDNPMYGGSGSSWRSRSEWLRVRETVIDEKEICQWCGSTEDIHVHHSIPVFAGGDKYDINNLTTLCESCHVKVHKRIDPIFRE